MSSEPCLSEYSTAEELDMLFNEKDGILPFLADDTFIGMMENDNGDFELDKAFDADDLFSQVLNGNESHIEPSHDHPYSKDQQFPRSPLNSDSGISDSCQRSPYSDLQSEPSPGRLSDDGSNLEEVVLDTIDLSCMLTGGDAMLLEDNMVSTTMQDSSGDESSHSVYIEEVGFGSNLRLTPSESQKETLPLTMQNGQTFTPCEDANSKYHLVLTEEEKRLLNDMSMTLPTDMPLTKEEERSLKAVRRKIRNKASAQNSRKRKKVYVDGLEHRVQMCTRNNVELQKKMDKLEKENRSLLDQLKGLRNLVAKSTSKAAQASTCVMVLLFSFALLVAPSFNPFSGTAPETANYQPNGVVSRTLKHIDVGDTGLVHEEVNLAGPPQSFADENPKVMLGRRSMMTQTEDDVAFDEDGKEMINNEKSTATDEQTKEDIKVEDVKTVVKSPNEAQRNNSKTDDLNKDKVEPDKEIVTNNVESDKKIVMNNVKNSAEFKTEQKGRKHAGDEM